MGHPIVTYCAGHSDGIAFLCDAGAGRVEKHHCASISTCGVTVAPDHAVRCVVRGSKRQTPRRILDELPLDSGRRTRVIGIRRLRLRPNRHRPVGLRKGATASDDDNGESDDDASSDPNYRPPIT